MLAILLILAIALAQDDKGWDREDQFCGDLNCYEILGVKTTANKTEIKKAFRELGKKYHPDKSTEPDAEDRMKEVNMAYQVLSSETRRRGYDNMMKMRKAMDAPRENPILVFLGLF